MGRKEPAGQKKSDPETIRTFIAIQVPDPIKEQISRLLEELKRRNFSAKWTRPENMHLTLKFIGDVRLSDMAPLCQAVADVAAGFAPVLWNARGVGVFPNVRNARVVWTGISGETEPLAGLHQAIDERFYHLGYERDERRFTGHLTLGRLKGRVDGHGLIDMMQEYADWTSDAVKTDAVHVIQSDLTPSGPVYKSLAKSQLTG